MHDAIHSGPLGNIMKSSYFKIKAIVIRLIYFVLNCPGQIQGRGRLSPRFHCGDSTPP